MVADTRRVALSMFPDKELAFNLIYWPRLQRLMRRDTGCSETAVVSDQWSVIRNCLRNSGHRKPPQLCTLQMDESRSTLNRSLTTDHLFSFPASFGNRSQKSFAASAQADGGRRPCTRSDIALVLHHAGVGGGLPRYLKVPIGVLILLFLPPSWSPLRCAARPPLDLKRLPTSMAATRHKQGRQETGDAAEVGVSTRFTWFLVTFFSSRWT